MEAPLPRPHKRVPLRIIHGFRSGTFSFGDVPTHGYILENMTRVVPFHDAQAGLSLHKEEDFHVEPLSKLARAASRAQVLDTKRLQWFAAPELAYAPGSQRVYPVLSADNLVALVEALVVAGKRGVVFDGFGAVTRRAAALAALNVEQPLAARIDAHAGYKQETMPALDWVGTATKPRDEAFPSEFFERILRLRGEPNYDANSRPSYFGWIIRSLVYQRLGPGVYEAMKDAAERTAGNRHRTRLYQHLSDAGRDAMDEQVQLVIKMARQARDYDHLLELVDKHSTRYK